MARQTGTQIASVTGLSRQFPMTVTPSLKGALNSFFNWTYANEGWLATKYVVDIPKFPHLNKSALGQVYSTDGSPQCSPS